MELTLLGLIIAAVGGALAYDRYAQQSHVSRLRAQWETGHPTVQMPPVGVICHGDRPNLQRDQRAYGAVGIADHRFVFQGQRVSTWDCAIPTETIRWIGLRTEVKHSWNRRQETQTLIVHLDAPEGWRVYTFTHGRPGRWMLPVAEALAQHADLPWHDMDEIYEDYGPDPAVRLVQDRGGAWQVASAHPLDLDQLPPDWDGTTETLYLAPDRLLFDWQHPILLAHIRRVDVLARASVPSVPGVTHDLLCLDVQPPGGALQVIGFALDHASDWANEINAQREALAGN